MWFLRIMLPLPWTARITNERKLELFVLRNIIKKVVVNCIDFNPQLGTLRFTNVSRYVQGVRTPIFKVKYDEICNSSIGSRYDFKVI